jgi:hypothetical protein
LEAYTLENQYGNRANVSSVLNFIRVDSIKVVLQTGSNSIFGSNGVGGVTAEGTIGQYSIEKDLKSLSYKVRFNVNSNIGMYDVFMTVGPDTYARATVTGLGPGRLTYSGRLEALYNSAVFKGQNALY